MASESVCRRNCKNAAKPDDLILDLLRISHQGAIKQRKILPWGMILITHRVLTRLSELRFFSISLPVCDSSSELRVKHLYWVERGRGTNTYCCLSASIWKPRGNLLFLFPAPAASVLWPSGAGGLRRTSDDTPEQPGCGAGPGAGRLHGRQLGRGVHAKGMSDFAALFAGGRVSHILKLYMGLWLSGLFLVREKVL